MNQKNTLLVAILINAGLLAVLFVTALTVQDDPPQPSMTRYELPQLDDVPLYQELALLPLEPVKEQVAPPEPVVHKLPELVIEKPKEEPVLVVKEPTAQRPLSEVVVKKGDNLEKLARNHQTSVDEIIKLNRLPSSFLKIGQVLKIPEGKSLVKAPIKEREEEAEYYTIKVGENPWAIAMKHHMKLDELLKLNGLNEEKARKLKPGARLKIK